jgi:energy-converting hydrogenase Eha subunit F
MSKRTFKKPKRVQFIYFLLIFISGGSLFFIKNQPEDQQNIWVMLLLLLVLMYSLMKSTQNWAYDNPKPDPEEEEKEKLVYKDRDIPSLEDMIKKNKDK